MSTVKKTDEYTISKRRDGRYAVTGVDKKPINGEEKVRILVAEDLIKVNLPKPEPVEEEAAQEEAASGESAEQGEASAEAGEAAG
jgi:hypothetical protein